jgi:hypothetical protein
LPCSLAAKLLNAYFHFGFWTGNDVEIQEMSAGHRPQADDEQGLANHESSNSPCAKPVHGPWISCGWIDSTLFFSLMLRTFRST